MKKRLLEEKTTRRFMKLANIGTLTENFIDDTVYEQEEELPPEDTELDAPPADEPAEEPGLDEPAEEDELAEADISLEEDDINEEDYLNEVVRRVAARLVKLSAK